jgi:hypothetical protein
MARLVARPDLGRVLRVRGLGGAVSVINSPHKQVAVYGVPGVARGLILDVRDNTDEIDDRIVLALTPDEATDIAMAILAAIKGMRAVVN